MIRPLCIDLFCGLGGWAEGFISEGYDVIGFDVERHRYEVECPQCMGTGNLYGNDIDGDFLDCDCYESYDNYGKVVAVYPSQLVLQDVTTLDGIKTTLRARARMGTKQNGSAAEWFDQGIASLPSTSVRRKQASAMIAKIPEPLARYVARSLSPAVPL